MDDGALTDDQGRADVFGEDSSGLTTSAGKGRVALLLAGAGLATLLIVGGVLTLLGQGSAAKVRPNLVGQPARPFTVANVNGGRFHWPWLHHHATVMVFFADWCAPCHQEMPPLAKAAGSGNFGSVRVVGIDGDNRPGVATAFVAANNIHFPVAQDPNLVVAGHYVPAGFPATVAVSADGTVTVLRYRAIDVAELRGIVASLAGSAVRN